MGRRGAGRKERSRGKHSLLRSQSDATSRRQNFFLGFYYERMSCMCLNSHKTFGWRRTNFLLIALGIFMTSAILLPYITVVARQELPAFVPFISQSGGSPPQSGLLTIPLIFTGVTGFIVFTSLFVSINHRNKLNSIWLRRFNYLSFPIVIISSFGCIVTAAFPVDFTELPNQLEWIVTVLMEHGTGATMILVGIIIYQFFLAVVWWFLPDVTKLSKYIKIGFCVAYLIIFGVVLQPGVIFLYEELGHKSFDPEILRNRTSYELPKVFSPSYKILAFFEWAVCFMSLVNMVTIYKDFKRISLHVTLRPKSCSMDVPETTEISLESLS